MDHDSQLGGTSREGARQGFMWKGQWVPVFAGGSDDPPADPPKDDPPKDDPPAFRPVKTQEEFDRMVADRIARERRKFEGFDELKAKAAEFDKLKESQQTEQEKLQARAEQAEREREEARKEANSLKATIAIEKAATKAGVIDPEMAAQLIDRSTIEFDDDGSPKPDSLKSALEAVVEKHPILKGSRFQGGGDGGPRGGGGGDVSMSDRIRQMAGRGG